MLKLVQAGEVGKSRYLLDMYKFRKRIFHDRMQWPVKLIDDELEIDEFDLPQAVYLLALNEKEHVIASLRLLPSNGPTMIRNVWPEFLKSIEMPQDPFVWEASRFAVDGIESNLSGNLSVISHATAMLFCGMTELAILCGIEQIFAMYDIRLIRILQRMDCTPYAVSKKIMIGDNLATVGAYLSDRHMLKRLRAATGIHRHYITYDMLPPVLRELASAKPIDGMPASCSLQTNQRRFATA